MNRENRYYYSRIEGRNSFWKISPSALFFVIVLAVYILPSCKISVPYVVAGSLMLVVMLISWSRCSLVTNFSVTLIVTTGIVFLINSILGTYSLSNSLNEAIRNIRFFIPVIMAIFVIECCSPRYRKFVLACFAFLTLYILRNTLVALAQNQWITRILAQSSITDTAEIRMYRMSNVGGFEFSYMMGIVILCLVWGIFHINNIFYKIGCLCATVVCYYYIIQTMYTTLLLLTSVCVVILIVANVKDTRVRMVIAIAFILSIWVLPKLFLNLSHIFEGSLLEIKFSQMYVVMTGGEIDSLGSRPEKIYSALQLWLKNPIFGGSVDNKVHSLLVGLLASSGIIGTGAWLLMYCYAYQILKTKLEYYSISTDLVRCTFLFVLLLSFLNPTGYVFEITIAAFFIAPVWSTVVTEHNLRKLR